MKQRLFAAAALAGALFLLPASAEAQNVLRYRGGGGGGNALSGGYGGPAHGGYYGGPRVGRPFRHGYGAYPGYRGRGGYYGRRPGFYGHRHGYGYYR